MAIKLSDRLTSKQLEKCKKNSITTLYELITYFPYTLQEVLALDRSTIHTLRPEVVYRIKAVIASVQVRKSNQTKLSLTTTVGKIDVFSFLPFRFIARLARVGSTVHTELIHRNGFWTLKRMTQQALSTETQTFRPVYPSTSHLKNSDMQTIIARLHPEDFILDLRGLIPSSLGIAEIFSLMPIHRPSTKEEYSRTLTQWNTLHVFLRLLVYRSIKEELAIEQAHIAHYDHAYYKQLVDSLPYELSHSQNNAIESILLTITNKANLQ